MTARTMNCPRCNALWKEARAVWCCAYGVHEAAEEDRRARARYPNALRSDAAHRTLDENTLHAARYYAKDNPSGGVDG